MILADDLVTPGGPTAPVWAFLTAIVSIALTILGTQLKARSDLRRIKAETEMAKSEAQKANKSATKAEANTANISNGFARTVLAKLERIHQSQQKTEQAFREHLQWHLEHDDRR